MLRTEIRSTQQQKRTGVHWQSDDRRRRRLPDVEHVLLVVQGEELVAADGDVADGATVAPPECRRTQDR
jgi:hypothetical protein